MTVDLSGCCYVEGVMVLVDTTPFVDI